jgi:hypothetical protein
MSRSPYRWNDRAALFRDPATGRFVSRDTVRGWIDQSILKSQQRIQLVTDDVRAGRITVDEWQVTMREEIKRTQLASEMLARGGRAQMTPADFGRVGQRVRVQYGYLRDFASQLVDRSIRTDGSFLNRAKMYAAASRGAFHETEGDVLADAGYTLERNILAIAEHCEQCVIETRRGFVAIGSLIPIGERTCLVNCRCRLEYA